MASFEPIEFTNNSGNPLNAVNLNQIQTQIKKDLEELDTNKSSKEDFEELNTSKLDKEAMYVYKISLTIESGTTISNGTTIEWTKGYNYTIGQIEVYWNGCKLIEKTDSNSDGHYIANDDGSSAYITMYRTDDDGDYTLTEDAQVEIIIRPYIAGANFV